MPRKQQVTQTGTNTPGFVAPQTRTRARRGTRTVRHRGIGTGGTNSQSMASKLNRESQAIGICLNAIEHLSAIAQQRVLAYVAQSYHMNIPWPGFVGTESERTLQVGATR